jgi:hypothetical protein
MLSLYERRPELPRQTYHLFIANGAGQTGIRLRRRSSPGDRRRPILNDDPGRQVLRIRRALRGRGLGLRALGESAGGRRLDSAAGDGRRF